MWFVCLCIFQVLGSRSPVFFGFPELAQPAFSHAKGASQNFTHTDQHGTTILKYNVTHREDAFFLHLDSEDISDVKCKDVFTKGHLIISFVDAAKAQEVILTTDDLLISGGLSWGCRNVEGAPINLMLRATGRPQLSFGNLVSVSVTAAQFTDFFKHAEVHFETDKYPPGWFSAHDNEQTPKHEPVRSSRSLLSPPVLRWGFTSALVNIWDGIVSVGQLVKQVVATVPIVVKALATGKYDANETIASRSWYWNVDAQQKFTNEFISIDAQVSCWECCAEANLKIIFKLSIQNYNLQYMKLMGMGDTRLVVGAQIKLSAQFSNGYEKLLATIKMNPITFQLGPVPVVVDVAIPIVLGYNLDFTAEGSVDVEAGLWGSFQYGTEYTPSGGMRLLTYSDYSNFGNALGISTVSLTAQVYVLATMRIGLYYIGGPNVGMKVFLEAVIDGYTARPRPCAITGISLAINVGVEVTIGAEIEISLGNQPLYNKEFDPVGVFSAKYPILTGCYDPSFETSDLLQQAGKEAGMSLLWPPSKERRALMAPYMSPLSSRGGSRYKSGAPFSTNAPVVVFSSFDKPGRYGGVDTLGCAEGVTWVGSIVRGSGTDPECDLYPSSRILSLQTIFSMITGAGPDMTLVIAASDAEGRQNRMFSCVSQRTYRASIYPTGAMTFTRTSNEGSDYSYCTDQSSACSCETPQISMPSSFYGDSDPSLTTITLQDSLLCTKAVLTRVTPQTSGELYVGLNFTAGANSCGLGVQRA